MSPAAQQILEMTAIAWLVALMSLSFWGFIRLGRNGRNDVAHPRREVFRWLTASASQFSTGAALVALMVYFFTEWFDTYGLIVSIVYSVLIILAVAFLPIIARRSQGREQASSESRFD